MRNPSESVILDFCLAALLRSFSARHTRGMAFVSPLAGHRDREELLVRWALSETIEKLAMLVVENPRLIHSAINEETVTNSGIISGSVDARATLLEQQLRGDATIFVVNEPSVSKVSRRNHVLVWVLRQAETLIRASIRRHKINSDLEWIHNHLNLIETSLSISPLREILYARLDKRRPGSASIRDATKAVSPLYVLAAKAAQEYEEVESLNQATIGRILREAYISQYEQWEMLEIATALAASEAFAMVLMEPVNLALSIERSGVIAKVGPYEIQLQKSLPLRSYHLLDPSEQIVRECAESIDSSLGRSRADVTIRMSGRDIEVAHLECKWCSSESSISTSITNAINQLVRYCRDTRPNSLEDAKSLLSDCVVVCSQIGSFKPTLGEDSIIGLAGFDDLLDGKLVPWAKKIHEKHGLRATI